MQMLIALPLERKSISTRGGGWTVAFDDDVVQAICTYMNNDPMESNLTIVQGITGDRAIEKADLVFFDEAGADFRAYGPGGRRAGCPHPVAAHDQQPTGGQGAALRTA
jgi:hypothetical protein